MVHRCSLYYPKHDEPLVYKYQISLSFDQAGQKGAALLGDLPLYPPLQPIEWPRDKRQGKWNSKVKATSNLGVEPEPSNNETKDFVDWCLSFFLAENSKYVNALLGQDSHHCSSKHEAASDSRRTGSQDPLNTPGNRHCRCFTDPSDQNGCPLVILFRNAPINGRIQDKTCNRLHVTAQSHGQCDCLGELSF
jgi:hypothetical protein